MNRRISYLQFLGAFNELRKFHENGDDPLPEIGSRDKLLSALKYPFQEVYGVELFPTIHNKAACYFYGFVKGHIFINGNKRCGILAVNLFYDANGVDFNMPQDQMYRLAKRIANSDPSQKDAKIEYLSDLFKKYTN